MSDCECKCYDECDDWCPAHPMNRAKAENERLEKRLALLERVLEAAEEAEEILGLILADDIALPVKISDRVVRAYNKLNETMVAEYRAVRGEK